MKELLPLLCDYLEQGRPAALVSVIDHQGSTPRGTGSKLMADEEGRLVAGTIGGGLVEGNALAACREALRDGLARIIDFRLDGELAAQNEMICGGRLRLLVEPVSRQDGPRRFFAALKEAWRGEEAVFVTDLAEPSLPRRTARLGRAFLGAPLPEETVTELLAALPPGCEARACSHGGRDYFIERGLAPLRLIIAGGGHVSRPTAQMAALAGFEVSVLDDRPEFSQPGRFPWAARVVTAPGYRGCFASLAPDARTYLVIVTRGHLFDSVVLAQALRTAAGYIGLIGSRRKRAELYAGLAAQGVGEEELARVHCPIGLDIGAETPEEIAVSIVAECIRHRRKACPAPNMPR